MLLLENKRKNNTLDTIHFIGIGGIGMSGIAEILFNLGYKVQGSDIAENSNTKRLAEKGIKIIIGHAAENLTDISYVVTSSAIQKDNVEVKEAINKKIPLIKRAQMLAELMRLKFSIAVSGSHGKTTTTSLIACLFEAAGMDPTVINGGIINNRNTNAYLGKSDYLIAEADESDATFLKVPSTIGVITNIDAEHLEYYKDFSTLKNAFKSFLSNLPFYGFGVVCADHEVSKAIAQEVVDKKIITYGIESKDADIVAYNIELDISSSKFDIKVRFPNNPGTHIIENIIIPIPGYHNILNSLAAIAIGIELDFGIKAIRDGFRNFKGVNRRFTKIGNYNGADIIDDYAHHPAEIKATLATAKATMKHKKGDIVAIFQPHRYTRLRDLFEEFKQCFNDAQKVFILDVYSAGEEKIDGFDSQALATGLRSNKIDAHYVADKGEIAAIISGCATKDNVVVAMGAGDISSLSRAAMNTLQN